MATNLERFRKDLSSLLERSGPLELAAFLYAEGEVFKAKILEARKNNQAEADAIILEIPDFRQAYEAWYSEALRVISQLIPDRLNDFRAQYEVPKGRKTLTHDSYVIHDMLHGLIYPHSNITLNSGISRLRMQFNILKSAEKRYESSLFDIRQLVQADLFDSEIEVSRELLKNGFVRAAGAIAGVVLERHLRQVSIDHKVPSKAKPTLSTLNDGLKGASVIDVAQWRFNQHLGDIRNACDHAKEPEPTKEQVQDLIDGTAKVMKTIA